MREDYLHPAAPSPTKADCQNTSDHDSNSREPNKSINKEQSIKYKPGSTVVLESMEREIIIGSSFLQVCNDGARVVIVCDKLDGRFYS